MFGQSHSRSWRLGRSRRDGRRGFVQWLLVMTLLALSLLGGAAAPATTMEVYNKAVLPLGSATGAESNGRIDPRIHEIARQAPMQTVRVIVQKLAGDQGVEQWVEGRGGIVLSDLAIINAFAAEMSAEVASQLAQNPAVRWISLDAPVSSSLLGLGNNNAPSPANYYLDTLGIASLAQQGIDGEGIGIAILDSGVATDDDFTDLAVKRGFNLNSIIATDLYGHGTHIAGIVAGNGHDSNGKFRGIAPGATLIGLKISDDLGLAFESDVVAALQWVYEHKAQYNIRIINLSINSGVEASYHTSPLNAAAEILWFSGVVVVVSAGNTGEQDGVNTIMAPPANDPFFITVGASDERGTSSVSDDVMAAYSSHGTTTDGFLKPDIIAPGTGIYSVRAALSPWALLYPERLAGNGEYFRLSGSSMAAPMVVGVVALMLQEEPSLTPDQVKYRLLNSTARTLPTALDGSTVNIPYLDGAAAVAATTQASANTGLAASQLLFSGISPINWESVNWNSVNWNSVNWNSVNWNSVNWNSVNWNSAVLEPPTLGGILPLAEGESWEVPAMPTEIPSLEELTQTDQQFDSRLFLPTLSH